MPDTAVASIGDNSGELTEAEKIAANLAEKHAKIATRSKELVAALAKVPEVITTADEAAKVSEFVRMCTTFDKVADSTREEEKEPYLSGGRAVDGYFQNLRDPVKKTKTALLERRTVWDTKVDNEARELLRKLADQAREEAEVLAAKARTEAQRAGAQMAEQNAQDAKEAAAVKPAELTRQRTGTGVVSSLRREWRFEVIDPKKVPKKFMVPSEALIKGAVKAAELPDGTCPIDIPGVRIFEHKFSMVR